MEEVLNEEQLEEILRNIPIIITEDHNYRLLKPFSNKEIRRATFSMAHNKSSGSNGFPTEFFQRFWSILGKEVSDVIRELHTSGPILKAWNVTFLVVTPKVIDSKEFK